MSSFVIWWFFILFASRIIVRLVGRQLAVKHPRVSEAFGFVMWYFVAMLGLVALLAVGVGADIIEILAVSGTVIFSGFMVWYFLGERVLGLKRPQFAQSKAIGFIFISFGFVISLLGVCLGVWDVGVDWSLQNIFPPFMNGFVNGYTANFTAWYANATGQAFNASTIPTFSMTPKEVASMVIFNLPFTYAYIVMCLGFMAWFIFGYVQFARLTTRHDVLREVSRGSSRAS